MIKSSRFERARCSRIICVQAIYQILMRQQTQPALLHEILNFRIHQVEDYDYPPDPKMITLIINSYYQNTDLIFSFVESVIQEGWTLSKIDRVLQAILMSGASELLLTENMIPAPIIISEYVDIAKGFLNNNEYSYINKSLDQFAHSLGKSMRK